MPRGTAALRLRGIGWWGRLCQERCLRDSSGRSAGGGWAEQDAAGIHWAGRNPGLGTRRFDGHGAGDHDENGAVERAHLRGFLDVRWHIWARLANTCSGGDLRCPRDGSPKLTRVADPHGLRGRAQWPDGLLLHVPDLPKDRHS